MGFQGLKNENQIQGQTFQVPYESWLKDLLLYFRRRNTLFY